MSDRRDYDWVRGDLDMVETGYRFVFVPRAAGVELLPSWELLRTEELRLDEVQEFLYGPTPPAAVAIAHVSDRWTLVADPFFRLFKNPEEQSSARPGLILSLYRSVNYDTEFVWWQDGVLQLRFGFSSVSWHREGVLAESALPLLADVGFDLRDDESDEGLMSEVMHHNDERLAFLLLERLTELRLTPALLERVQFTGAVLTEDW